MFLPNISIYNLANNQIPIMDIPNLEICGICEKKGVEVFWFNPLSMGAHSKCVQVIQPSEKKLIKTIHDLFKDDLVLKLIAHVEAIKVVKRLCAPETLSKYIQKNGPEDLTRLFDVFGVAAVKNIAENRAKL